MCCAKQRRCLTWNCVMCLDESKGMSCKVRFEIACRIIAAEQVGWLS